MTERKPAIAGKSLRYRKSFRAKSAGPPAGRGAKGLYRMFRAAGAQRRDNGAISRATITGSAARPGACQKTAVQGASNNLYEAYSS